MPLPNSLHAVWLGKCVDEEEMIPLQNGSEGGHVTTPHVLWFCDARKICIMGLYEMRFQSPCGDG